MSAKTRPITEMIGALTLLFSEAIRLISGGKRPNTMIGELQRALQLFKENRLGFVFELGQTCPDEKRDELLSKSVEDLPFSRHAKRLLSGRGVRLFGEAFQVCNFEGSDRNLKTVQEIAQFLRSAGIPTGTDPHTCGWIPPYAKDPEILALWAKPFHELNGSTTCPKGCQYLGARLASQHPRWRRFPRSRLERVENPKLYSLMVVPSFWSPPQDSPNCEDWGWFRFGRLLVAGASKDRLDATGITTFEDLIKLPVEKIRELCTESDLGRIIGELRLLESESGETPALLREWRSLLNGQLDKRIDELEISVRTENVLQNLGITLVGQLVEYSPSDLLKARGGAGRKSLAEIQEMLELLGLELRPE